MTARTDGTVKRPTRTDARRAITEARKHLAALSYLIDREGDPAADMARVRDRAQERLGMVAGLSAIVAEHFDVEI